MAYTAHPMSAPGLVTRFFHALWNGLIKIGESNARTRVLRHIDMISDAQLAEAGVTRAELVERVTSNSHHI